MLHSDLVGLARTTTGTPYGDTGGNPLQFTDALGLDWLDDVGEWSAGFGDAVTGGGTEQICRLLNYTMNGESGDMVGHCSVFYTWGGYGGDAVNVGLLFIGGAEAGTALVERLDRAVAATSRVTVEASEVSSIASRGASAARTSEVVVGAGGEAASAAETGAGAENVVNGVRLRAQLTGEEIAGGHAFDKHVIDLGEFPAVTTRSQFAGVIEDVVTNGEMRTLSGGRTGYWQNGTVVIRNPRAVDGGTAFRPKTGYDYFLDSLH